MPGDVNCTSCPIGYFQWFSGETECQPCYAGSYCNRTGCSACDECPAGRESRHRAAYNCTLCEPGFSKPLASTSLCSQCAKGYYQTQAGQLTCLLCPEGFYCACFSCDPKPCPPEASCPAGSFEPRYQTCGPLFIEKNKKCLPTIGFYCLVAAIGVVTLVAIFILLERYRSRKHYLRARTEEEERLLSYHQRSTEEPVYQGF
ncbi:uncharacterized protein [Diadema antillarum]|uniref:uncharacterized protein n=1 Tax=Diadema antillarum TaxID=105358 RepID=UPI003A8AE664